MGQVLNDAERALRELDGAAALAAYDQCLTDAAAEQVRAAAGRVRALWLLRRWDEAREQLDALQDVDDSVEVWLARGVVALGQPDDPGWLAVDLGSARRDDAEAVAAFDAALRLDPGNAEAVAGKTTAVRMSGQCEQALQIIQPDADRSDAPAPVLVEAAMCAAESGVLRAAVSYADRAVETDPESAHARIVWLTLASEVDDSVEIAEHARRKLADDGSTRDSAPLLDAYGWACVNSVADVDDRELRSMYLERAHAAFERSMETGPVLPTAVTGAMWVHLEDRDVDTARDVAAQAIEQEPTSPRLNRCWAEIVTEEDGDAQARVDAYQKVLDRDPRDLHARVEQARAYHELDQPEQARTLINQVRDEVAGGFRGWRRLVPWELSAKRTRTSKPWENEADHPKHVLDGLVDEAIRRRRLRPQAADRLRVMLEADPRAALERGYAQEQEYLRQRKRLAAGWRQWLRTAPSSAWVLVAVGLLVMCAGAGYLAWHYTGLGSLAAGWRAGGTVGTVLLMGAAFWRFVVVGVLAGRVRTDLEAVAQTAFDDWLEVLYRKGVEPAAMEAMNRPGHLYGTRLTSRSLVASDEPVELETMAATQLRRLLRRSGGSFALAGPRGAGKSTLLDRWCDGQFLRSGDDEQPGPRRDLSIKVSAPVGYESQDFLIHLFSSTCRAVEWYARKHSAAWDDPPLWERRTRPRQRSRVTGHDLARWARQERESIRSVVSKTTEGEASVGVSGVLGAKGRTSIKRDELPLNHPELVDRFRVFLRRVAQAVGGLGGKVLIGIDELDRISDGNAAQVFVNELKAVFGVDNCYFLVSVSEDALAEFELSAMGMRTVFDSAFDRIVRVDYLSFDEARVVLQRRIVDITEQFVALAYVLSGALVRQLCRVADEIGVERSATERGLGAVAADLVGRQVSDVTRAAMDVLSGTQDRGGARLTPVLDDPPRRDITPDALSGFAARLAEHDLGESGDLSESVRLDVVARMEYFSAVLDVFDDSLDEDRMKLGRSATIADFETLARARRYVGAFPDGARALVDAFARAWDLPVGGDCHDGAHGRA